jgi:hypothetical protein
MKKRNKINEQRLLKKFIKEQQNKCLSGGGDDIFYSDQIVDYIYKQPKLFIELIKFIRLNDEKKK